MYIFRKFRTFEEITFFERSLYDKTHVADNRSYLINNKGGLGGFLLNQMKSDVSCKITMGMITTEFT